MSKPQLQKRDSWWKRHCTPPPAINRSAMCPCAACFQSGGAAHGSSAVPSTSYPQRPTYYSQSSSYESTHTSSASTPRGFGGSNLRKEVFSSKQKGIDASDLTPLIRQTTTDKSDYFQPRQSDELSIAHIEHGVQGRSAL